MSGAVIPQSHPPNRMLSMACWIVLFCLGITVSAKSTDGSRGDSLIDSAKHVRGADSATAADSLPGPGATERALAEDSLHLLSVSKADSLVRINDSIAIADSTLRKRLSTEMHSLPGRDSAHVIALQRRIDSISRSDSLRRLELKKSIEKLKGTLVSHPVLLEDDTLFLVFLKYGSFSSRERAEAVTRRVRDIAENRALGLDSLKLVPTETTVDIMFGERIVTSINDQDAIWYGTDRMDLAGKYLDRISSGLRKYREAHAYSQILFLGVKIVSVLLFLAAALFSVGWGFRRLSRRILGSGAARFSGFRISKVEIFSPQQQSALLRYALKTAELFSFGIVLYFFLPFLFAVIPATRGWSVLLVGWILSPLKTIFFGFLDYLPNLFNLAVIFFVVRFILKVTGKIFDAIDHGTLKIEGFYQDWARPTYSIVRFLIFVLTAIVVFPLLPGSDSPIFKGVSIFLGVLFSLGSTSAVSNLVAGLVITYMRPFRVGDRVKLGEVTGDVIEKNMLVTRLRTIKNEDITIPNTAILSNHTVNYSTSSENLGLILHSTITIGYDEPWDKIHRLLIAAAKRTDGILGAREPFVLQTSLDDFYVSYQVNAYTDRPKEMAAIYSRLFQNIQDLFGAEGVEIMSPHYMAARDGNRSTIPAPFLPTGYSPPPFRVAARPQDGEG